MNKPASIFLLSALLLVSTGVFAATIINIEIVDLANPNNPTDKRIGYIEGGKMSIRSNTATRDTDLLYDESRSTITIINHQERTFMLLDAQSITKFMSGTMQMINRVQEQLSRQMQGLSPEQRAKIEKMMGGLAPPRQQSEGPPIEYIDTRKSRKVNGIACQITRLVKAGRPVTEICLAKTTAIKMPAIDLKTLLSMQATAVKLASAAAPLLKRIGSQMPEFGGKTLEGIPLVVTDLSGGNRMQMTVKSVSQGKTPTGAMLIPKGYRPSKLPSLN